MRRHVERWIRLLIGANVVLVLALMVVVLLDAAHSTAGHPPQSSPTPGPSASVELMPMGLAHIPTSDACVLCHEGGGSGGIKTIPALGHPLEGWRECLVCHTDAKLGRSAPGHAGIPQSECLNCHKEAKPGPPITQPHTALHDQHCLDCHGNVAHLPSSMASRNEDECTVCHKPTASPPPAVPHVHDDRVTCRECHQSPEIGSMPIDHALRSDATCLLCHDIVRATPAPGATSRPAPTPVATAQGAQTRWPLVAPGPVVAPVPAAAVAPVG